MEKIQKFFDQYENIKNPQPWDNTGIIIDCKNKTDRFMLTIDVTNQVIDECLEHKILNIVSYHPFIFKGIKTIDKKYIKVIQNNISVYSIHTRLDYDMCLDLARRLKLEVSFSSDTFVVARGNESNFEEYIKICKSFTNVNGIRYVTGSDKGFNSKFKNIIIGVGSAQKEFMEHVDSSLIISGEMSHHDMLFYRENGCCVILMEHSNIERIYLPTLMEKMKESGVDVKQSETDTDPVEIFC